MQRSRTLGSLLSLCWCLAFLQPLLGGELRTETLRSEALGGKEVKLHVLLPDGYGDAASAEKHYPTVYLLHGYGGDYTEWIRVGVEKEAAGLQAILVFPEGDQSFYINHHGDAAGRWEDYITSEVLKLVDGKFRTHASRDGRGVSGLSMGGFGALMLGFRHPGLFASAASHSGALGVPGSIRRGEIGERLAKIFGPEDSAERKAYDLVRLASELPAEKRPAIYIDCGSQDFLLNDNRAFVAELAKLKAAYEYREVPGGHTFDYWKANVRYSLERQLAVLKAPGKAAPPAPAAVEAASVAGLWNVRLVLPSGDTGESTLEIRQQSEKVQATARWDSGSLEIPSGKLSGDRLVLEAEFDRDGEKMRVRVDVKVVDDELAGHWLTLDQDGKETFRGEWNATLARRGEPAAAPKEAPKAGALAGEWVLQVELFEQTLDYSMRFKGPDDKLEAVLISPRSGEHACKSAAFRDGNLRVEIDRDLEGMVVTFVYEGKLDGETIAGNVVVKNFEQYNGKFTAKRKAAAAGEKKDVKQEEKKAEKKVGDL
jgi:S-formylglutathione hydrolase FrmB